MIELYELSNNMWWVVVFLMCKYSYRIWYDEFFSGTLFTNVSLKCYCYTELTDFVYRNLV